MVINCKINCKIIVKSEKTSNHIQYFVLHMQDIVSGFPGEVQEVPPSMMLAVRMTMLLDRVKKSRKLDVPQKVIHAFVNVHVCFKICLCNVNICLLKDVILIFILF